MEFNICLFIIMPMVRVNASPNFIYNFLFRKCHYQNGEIFIKNYMNYTYTYAYYIHTLK